MTLFIKGHSYGYELQRVAQMFCFGQKVQVREEEPPKDFAEEYIYTEWDGAASKVIYHCPQKAEKRVSSSTRETLIEENLELTFGAQIFEILSAVTGLYPPWGVLTGIRPVKLFLKRLRAGLDLPALGEVFLKNRRLDPSRFALALQTAQTERPLLERSTQDSFSLYVSIPFCPSRCTYCSFVSHSVEQAVKLIPVYIDKLIEELAEIGRFTRQLNLKLRTIYFGGGTPTVFNASQLERLMEAITEQFDLSDLWEYTVEAGRPDTITQEKLETIRKMGAGRISVNPQTLSDSVLQAVGRKHTAAQCMECYQMAKGLGFSVNMDLIAGLPTDTLEGFLRSVNGLIEAGPDNITIHTLTVKRAAQLCAKEIREQMDMVRNMVDNARTDLEKAGYFPYYLYRQTGTLSSLENVGYAKPGTECLYNIYMMDETHSVFAAGAGACTRLCHPRTGKIQRIYNYKYPYEYLERFEAIKDRKKQITAFFSTVL